MALALASKVQALALASKVQALALRDEALALALTTSLLGGNKRESVRRKTWVFGSLII